MANIHLMTIMHIQDNYPAVEVAVKSFLATDFSEDNNVYERYAEQIKAVYDDEVVKVLEDINSAIEMHYSEDDTNAEEDTQISTVRTSMNEVRNSYNRFESAVEDEDYESYETTATDISSKLSTLSSDMTALKKLNTQEKQVEDAASLISNTKLMSVEDNNWKGYKNEIATATDDLFGGVTISSNAYLREASQSIQLFSAVMTASETLYDDAVEDELNTDEIENSFTILSNAYNEVMAWYDTWPKR